MRSRQHDISGVAIEHGWPVRWRDGNRHRWRTTDQPHAGRLAVHDPAAPRPRRRRPIGRRAGRRRGRPQAGGVRGGGGLPSVPGRLGHARRSRRAPDRALCRLPGRLPPWPRCPAGQRFGAGPATSAGRSRRTGGSCARSRDCNRWPRRSASTTKPSGAPSSSPSSTRVCNTRSGYERVSAKSTTPPACVRERRGGLRGRGTQ